MNVRRTQDKTALGILRQRNVHIARVENRRQTITLGLREPARKRLAHIGGILRRGEFDRRADAMELHGIHAARGVELRLAAREALKRNRRARRNSRVLP